MSLPQPKHGEFWFFTKGNLFNVGLVQNYDKEEGEPPVIFGCGFQTPLELDEVKLVRRVPVPRKLLMGMI